MGALDTALQGQGLARQIVPGDGDCLHHSLIKTLILCTDQESKQQASAYYLQFEKQLFLIHVPDPGHRGVNDTWLALADARLSKAAMVHLALYNIKYGPWSKSGFFRKVQECARIVSESLSPNDELLQLFFPQILRATAFV